MTLTHCACGSQILLAMTPTGKTMPLNAKPDEAGNIALLDRDPPQRPIAEYVGPPGKRSRDEKRTVYMPHWNDCPHAERYRTKKRVVR